MVKYILVSGGVLSGLGKGIVASSVGRILKTNDFSITSVKIDPYLNVDAGTISPYEHGEVYVTEDGGETDLDMGNYERFIDIELSRDNNITTGKVYRSVIEKEREGKYLGKTVQVVPHIVDCIKDWVKRVGEKFDICVIELGGTIGDIESMPFVEAMRQLSFEVGQDNFCNVHVSLVPCISSVGEQKTKPTQASVRSLRSLGLSPNIIVCRSTAPLQDDVRKKISQFCQVSREAVIGCHDVKNIYDVALLLQKQGIDKTILQTLKVDHKLMDFQQSEWAKLSQKYNEINEQPKKDAVHIAFIGKYTGLKDSYLSVIKAMTHASLHAGVRCEINWIESDTLESHYKDQDEAKKSWDILKSSDGVIILGGFGNRGTEGKIEAAKYCRISKTPMLGICLGMQVAVIEFARNVLGWEGANSEEFAEKDSDVKKVIVFMPEFTKDGKMGGTMRLGARQSFFKTENSKLFHLYGQSYSVTERHRHRYEVNPKYVADMEKEGLIFVGQDDTGMRQEIIELKDHPFYCGVQYHPEFTSRPTKANPCFFGLLEAAHKAKKNKE